MASFAITVYLNVSNIMPVKMYELIQSYKATDLTNMQGMILRGTIYITAIVLVFAIINLMPDKEYRWTKYGQRTLCIYVLSSFVIVQIYRLIENSNLNKESFAIQIVGALFITAVTMVVTGNKYVNKGYSVIMDTLSSKLVNKI